MCKSIGILYHDSDSKLVTQIVKILEGPFFTQCFFAGRDIVNCDFMYVFDFLEYILSNCKKFIIVLSDNFFSSRETRLDLMSFLFRFDQGNCKVSFVMNGEPNIPYRRLLALEKSSPAAFISATKCEGDYFGLVKAINRALSDEVARISEFPLYKYKFVFGTCEDGQDVHEVLVGPSDSHQHAVLDVQNTVVTFKAGSKKIILDKGIQLCSSGHHDLRVVIERMQLSAEIMKSVTDVNPAFAPLIPSVTPLYFLAVNPARIAEDGASGSVNHPDLKAQLQLWSLRDSKPSKHYRVMFSETVNFFGGNWSDATDISRFARNDEAACFELELKKYGVYLLCEVDQTSLEDMTKVSCVLQAMSDFLTQNYQRFATIISSDRRKVTFCTMRPSDDNYLSAVCTTESRCHRQAFVRLPKSTITLEVILDIEAGWKRMRVPATFDLHKQSVCCKTVPLKEICHQAKISCSITEKKEVVFEFKYKMASKFLRSPELTRSLMASSVTSKGDCNRETEYEESSSRRKHSTPELDERTVSLFKQGYAGRSRSDRSKEGSTRNSNESPRYNPDGVITARHLTRPVSADDEFFKARRQLHYP